MAQFGISNRRQWHCPELMDFRRYIRLLHIEPSNNPDDLDTPILCTVKEYHMDKLPAYFAISYACGNRTELKEIFVGDQSTRTYASLERALQRLRQQRARQAPILVWADALCIRQDDLVEKTAQVTLMAKVYGLAAEVVIWLGEVDEYNARVFPSGFEMAVDWRRMSPSPELIWQVFELLRRPWWSRLWCYQELCLSTNGFFLCGKREVPITVFLNFLWRFIARMAQVDPSWASSFGGGRGWFCGESAISTIETAVKLWRNRSTGLKHNVELVDLLVSFRAAQCSDPRDRIFASLSLVSDETLVRRNVPSYGLTVRKVYARLAASVIETSGGLHVLNYCTDKRSTPTWVPDWQDAEHPRWPIAKVYHILSQNRFNASGTTQAVCSIDETAVSKPQSITLRARGVTLGVISKPIALLGDVSRLQHPRDSPLPQWLEAAEYGSFRGRGFKERLFWFWDAVLASGLYDSGRCQASPDGAVRVRQKLLADFVESGAHEWPLDEAFQHTLHRYAGDRQFFITDEGLMGTVWDVVLRPEDEVCVLFGGPTPYIVRKASTAEGEDAYEFIRECYVSWYMYGEVIPECDRGIRKSKEFAFI